MLSSIISIIGYVLPPEATAEEQNETWILLMRLIISIISIIGAVLTPKIIMETIRSIKDKPRFFIYELCFNKFSDIDDDKKDDDKKDGEKKDDEKKEYQMKGRLVGKTNEDYLRNINFELPFDCEWKSESNYSCHKKGYSGWKQSSGIIKPTIEKNILTIDYSEDLKKSVTYDFIGNYAVPNEPKDLSYAYSFIEVSSKKKDENGKEKEEKLKVIKCPNTKKSWLLHCVFLGSLGVIGLGTTSILGCINNWKYFVNADFEMCFVFVVFGLLLLILMVFCVCMCWKTISAYFVLRKMEKLGVPHNTEKVAQKSLVSTIFEFMTGTETIDNIL